MTGNELKQVFRANLKRAMAEDPSIGTALELEAKSGVSDSAIGRWLADPPQSSPTLDYLAMIAQAIGCKPWELLVDDNTSAEDIVKRLRLGRR